jgi:hypothetical protein
MAMRLLVGRTRCHIPQEWSQTDQEDRQPTASYLWDVVRKERRQVRGRRAGGRGDEGWIAWLRKNRDTTDCPTA